jgi:hypothetical protein
MKRYIIVTIVLQHPLFDYGRLMDYVRQFDWREAVAHTATNKSVFLFTDKPEKEIQDRMRALIGPEDFVSVCSYDSENGPAEIRDQAERVFQWIA